MIPRTPEPELMDEAGQARAYAAADFDGPNTAFVGHVEAALGGQAITGRLLDLGCGPADICIRLARRHSSVLIDALDGSDAMLDCAREALAAAGHDIAARIRLLHARLPAPALDGAGYDTITSNSLLHHLHDPMVLWDAVRRTGRTGTRVVIMDLFRADSTAAAAELVDRYAAGEPEILRTDFYNSLLAAFTPDEVRAQLAAAGLAHFEVTTVSDRHLLVVGELRCSSCHAAGRRSAPGPWRRPEASGSVANGPIDPRSAFTVVSRRPKMKVCS
jgi:SAM-dependent methyltransferase